MTRHSKNASAGTHFTYHERKKAGYGTLKRRYGQDAQIAFGVCCLCLSSVHGNEPLASPSGFIYCKECIYTNLLSQKQAIQEQTKAYEKYMEQQEEQAQDAQLAEERASLQAFLTSHAGHATPSTSSTKDNKQEIVKQLTEKVDSRTDQERRKDLQRTSFWIPEATPETQTVVHKPDSKTKDPMSNEPMKMKHLMPVQFTWSEPNDTDKGRNVLCAVTQKEITHQQAVLLRPSGQVVLASCLENMVLPTMTCPVTGLKLRKKDLIYLHRQGTSFSAHSNVEAKKYRPSTI